MAVKSEELEWREAQSSEIDDAEGNKNGVVLSMADKVMLGNGVSFQARRVGDECWEAIGSD